MLNFAVDLVALWASVTLILLVVTVFNRFIAPSRPVYTIQEIVRVMLRCAAIAVGVIVGLFAAVALFLYAPAWVNLTLLGLIIAGAFYQAWRDRKARRAQLAADVAAGRIGVAEYPGTQENRS